ncbi:hypothetical protein FH972_024293 [Carpinus fangiana]|uniref:PARP-type domain-containing protein n=1 Tax=Carpinus fangiana TaxID=176857 RepID=A0A5N6KYC9_9ROSI|nr:hypothetical protein FH972_024293 [Carpinus fangiana]
MSANLLADLDSFYIDGNQTPTFGTTPRPATDDRTRKIGNDRVNHVSTNRQVEPSQEDDDFGDFEGPSIASGYLATEQAVQPTAYEPWADLQWTASNRYDDRHQRSRLTSTNIPLEHGARTTSLGREQADRPAPRQPRPVRDENVLFDADDDSDATDEFGHFEATIPSPAQKVVLSPPLQVSLQPIEQRRPVWEPPRNAPAPNLLDVDAEYSPADSSHQASALFPDSVRPKLPGHGDESSQGKATIQKHNTDATKRNFSLVANKELPQADEVDDYDAEAWDDFNDSLAQGASVISATPPATAPLALPRLLPDVSTTNAVPPNNIPPPTVVFTLFPIIFRSVQSQLLDELAHVAAGPNERVTVVSHPAVKQYLKDLISIATTCGHVISGRKNRWKRDSNLAQSMRIGPASTSGKSGGMKLAGIDKGENAKEEREAADVVTVWKRQVGRLRTAMAGVDGLPRPPEISETMPVRVATQAEGALNALKPCTLCGLKRNERVNKVDVDVQDSFGEWWVEHWGHYGCMAFWEGYKDRLSGR